LFKHSLVCAECGLYQNPYNLRTLIHSGFWPCSIKTLTYIVTMDVLSLWDTFRKWMPGSSQKAFLNSLDTLTIL